MSGRRTPQRVSRRLHGQKISDADAGDCWRACMSVLLAVPNGEHLPTHTAADGSSWYTDWMEFLKQFGLSMYSLHDPDGPMWHSEPWIASVPSKNFEGCSHAIVMWYGGQVMFDPSFERRYHVDHYLSGKGIVTGGSYLAVRDVTKLPKLEEWRKSVLESE